VGGTASRRVGGAGDRRVGGAGNKKVGGTGDRIAKAFSKDIPNGGGVGGGGIRHRKTPPNAIYFF